MFNGCNLRGQFYDQYVIPMLIQGYDSLIRLFQNKDQVFNGLSSSFLHIKNQKSTSNNIAQ